MEHLQVIARWRIHDGNLESFKKLANKCLAVIKAKNPNMLQYDWYFSENQKECVVIEKFLDSKALLAHLANIGDLFGKLLAVADLRAEIYGEPSKELLQATARVSVEVYYFYQSLETATL
jgi:quinol monooxygenase YgiN